MLPTTSTAAHSTWSGSLKQGIQKVFHRTLYGDSDGDSTRSFLIFGNQSINPQKHGSEGEWEKNSNLPLLSEIGTVLRIVAVE
ncbi:hypothetical protein VTN96DRAFT_8828 [Rasamsonia emersonii]